MLLLPLSLLSACSAAPPPPAADALRASLERAELAFAAATAARGPDGWVEAFAEDGMMLGSRGNITKGHAAVRARITPALAAAKLTWRPTLVEVAPSGDMGFTYGLYEASVAGKDGVPVVSRGTFMTVWKRGPDGSWKVLADHGSEDPPAATKPAAPPTPTPAP
jgi:ketosteroid isomerase-like protein